MKQLACGQCKTQLNFRAELAGKQVRCPNCKAIMVMPALDPKPKATSPQTATQQPGAQKRPASQRPAAQPARPQQQRPQQQRPPQRPAQQRPQQTPVQQAPVQQAPAPFDPLAGSGDPLQAQPSVLQSPLGVAQPPAWQQQQQVKKKGMGKGCIIGMIVGGVSFMGIAVLAVVLVLVFKPWLSGPERAFYKLRDGLANGNYVVMYDLSTEEGKRQIDESIDMQLSFGFTDEAKELKNLSGRARFVRLLEMSEDSGRMRKSMERRRDEIRSAQVTSVEYEDDGKTAIVHIESTDSRGKLKEDKIKMVKEGGSWKMGFY